jgi:hypothetical protein
MNARKLLCPLALIALALGLGACATAADSGPATAADAGSAAAAEAASAPVETGAVETGAGAAAAPAAGAELFREGEWQEGTACVSSSAPVDKCPAQYKGLCRTGRANGCTHDACTAAKNQARANVRAATPAGCHAYIQSTAPCRKGPNC